MQGVGLISVTLCATSVRAYYLCLFFIVVVLYNSVVKCKSNIQCKLCVDITLFENDNSSYKWLTDCYAMLSGNSSKNEKLLIQV